MSQQISIVESIMEAGERLHNTINIETDISPNLHDWMSSFGLDKANEPNRALCDLAAFNRLLKITLYQVYREEGVGLSQLSTDEKMYSKLVAAHAETGDPAFTETILDEFIEHVESGLFTPLFEARRALLNADQPIDEVGRIFEALLSQKVRRKRGQFRTPTFVGSFMAQWAITSGDDIVLDPGVGAGALTGRMYNQKQEALGEASVSDMWGVDVSELAIVMASTALKLENGEGVPNFVVTDFMDTMVEGSSARLDQQEPTPLPKMDAIVSNPPYSRSHALDGNRQKYNRIVDTESNFSTTEHTPLDVYFFAHSEQFLKEEGRMAFITGSRFLDTDYGEHLKEFILDRFTIHALLFPSLKEPIFGELAVDPCITLLEKGQPAQRHETAFIEIDEWPETDRLIAAVTSGEKGEVPFGFVNRVEQATLEPGTDWRRYVNQSEVDSIPGLTKFSRIATIRRGIATGKNDYFCLTQNEVEEWGLDKSYLSPLIRRTSGIKQLAITEEHWEEWKENGDEVWLLYCYSDGKNENEDRTKMEHIDDPALQAYLEHGREIGADTSFLAKDRDPWYVVDKRSEPDVLVTYMSKDGFRFIRNDAGIRSLNNLHNIHFSEADGVDLTEDQKDALLAYLNSEVADEITKRSSRTYAHGLHKIEPGELKDVPVIDPRNLTEEEVRDLAEAYNTLCSAIDDEQQSSQEAHNTLNAEVCKVLGLPNE